MTSVKAQWDKTRPVRKVERMELDRLFRASSGASSRRLIGGGRRALEEIDRLRWVAASVAALLQVATDNPQEVKSRQAVAFALKALFDGTPLAPVYRRSVEYKSLLALAEEKLGIESKDQKQSA